MKGLKMKLLIRSLVTVLPFCAVLFSCGVKENASSNFTSSKSLDEIFATTVYSGKSTFFEGSDQYKVKYCATEECSKYVSEKDLTTAQKATFANIAVKNAAKKKNQYNKIACGSCRTDFSLKSVNLEDALGIIKSPEGEYGESSLNSNDLQKITNYLNKNKGEISLFIADFYFTGIGDGATSDLAIYNARTSWVTLVNFANYEE